VNQFGNGSRSCALDQPVRVPMNIPAAAATKTQLGAWNQQSPYSRPKRPERPRGSWPVTTPPF